MGLKYYKCYKCYKCYFSPNGSVLTATTLTYRRFGFSCREVQKSFPYCVESIPPVGSTQPVMGTGFFSGGEAVTTKKCRGCTLRLNGGMVG